MSEQEIFDQTLREVVQKDPRYPIDAYYFIYEALDYTQRLFKKKGHMTGQQLVEGIRSFAQEHYGLMARTVFETWGIRKTEDFGELVFNLVENDLLQKTPQDSREDFKELFDFEEALEKGFDIARSDD